MKGKSTYLDWDTSFIPILMSQSLLLPKLMNFKKRWRFISFSTSLQASKLRWFEKTQTSTSSPAYERPWMIKEDHGRPWKTLSHYFHMHFTLSHHFHTFTLSQSLGRWGCTTQCIPPLGSVQIRYIKVH